MKKLRRLRRLRRLLLLGLVEMTEPAVRTKVRVDGRRGPLPARGVLEVVVDGLQLRLEERRVLRVRQLLALLELTGEQRKPLL